MVAEIHNSIRRVLIYALYHGGHNTKSSTQTTEMDRNDESLYMPCIMVVVTPKVALRQQKCVLWHLVIFLFSYMHMFLLT